MSVWGCPSLLELTVPQKGTRNPRCVPLLAGKLEVARLTKQELVANTQSGVEIPPNGFQPPPSSWLVKVLLSKPSSLCSQVAFITFCLYKSQFSLGYPPVFFKHHHFFDDFPISQPPYSWGIQSATVFSKTTGTRTWLDIAMGWRRLRRDGGKNQSF